MNLLESLLALNTSVGARKLQRSHLYVAVTRLCLHLMDILRPGDSVVYEGRTYTMRLENKTEGGRRSVFIVDNGRGPATLGERVEGIMPLPFASYEEHLFFAEHAEPIVDLFGELIKQDIRRTEAAEQNVIAEAQHAERIV
jgi:hypothetical protein